MIQRQDEAREMIRKKVVDYNEEQLSDQVKTPLEKIAYVIQEEGELVGGVSGTMFWEHLHLDFLWVAESKRGNQYGRKLLKRIEKLAEEKACRLILLDSFSFQAPGFYLREGYEICGKVDNHPEGHTQYFLQKRLN
ncbi:GNAT family N-acetyltransferase [Pseudalkalibacillus hwajinpoensis]|uniref:GNAT family N-acetyltransferase n=1 Tax=Guptibacillus hwajinpoensis TaxID=208199 RepID=A0A4V5PZ41_9BACL|nr:GNAT family N-acetyltransferase [Pseudalkalibacillus hwajinpoensis]TKD72548.1 GNAT family N-acetyltransferase [Pseudalkalibacillus hwajinpoensis]